MPITDDELRNLIALSEAATPGPWGYTPETRHEIARMCGKTLGPEDEQDVADDKLIVASRNAIAPLAAELLEARGKLAAVRKHLEKHVGDVQRWIPSEQLSLELLAIIDGKDTP